MSLSQTEAARQARSEAGRHAIEARWAKVTDPAEREAQTAAMRRAAYVAGVIKNWPELTKDQQARLRALLRPVGGGADV